MKNYVLFLCFQLPSLCYCQITTISTKASDWSKGVASINTQVNISPQIGLYVSGDYRAMLTNTYDPYTTKLKGFSIQTGIRYYPLRSELLRKDNSPKCYDFGKLKIIEEALRNGFFVSIGALKQDLKYTIETKETILPVIDYDIENYGINSSIGFQLPLGNFFIGIAWSVSGKIPSISGGLGVDDFRQKYLTESYPLPIRIETQFEIEFGITIK